MACQIAQNIPLQRLARHLRLQIRCHSSLRSGGCVHGLPLRDTSELVLGASGAAIGYCQALFAYAGEPAVHTEKVRTCLESLQAPWARSHELFWGHRVADISSHEYLRSAVRPLCVEGRVPVIITSLDPAADNDEVAKLMASIPPVPEGETILIRLALRGGTASVEATVELISRLLKEAEATKQMPKCWPLLQGMLSPADWQSLRWQLGSKWPFVNVAVNPFTSVELFESLRDNITVAQLPIGLAEGMTDDGNVQLAPGMKITGADAEASYNLWAFLDNLARRHVTPTLIVLGPSLPDWDDQVNRDRLARFLPLLRRGCGHLWNHLPEDSREQILALSA